LRAVGTKSCSRLNNLGISRCIGTGETTSHRNVPARA
jgi:hypothetical protein